jgi:hypothetical protein
LVPLTAKKASSDIFFRKWAGKEKKKRKEKRGRKGKKKRERGRRKRGEEMGEEYI